LTWEPAEHLENASEALKVFFVQRTEEREAAKPGKKRFIEVPPDPRSGSERRLQLAAEALDFYPPPLSKLEDFFKETLIVKVHV